MLHDQSRARSVDKSINCWSQSEIRKSWESAARGNLSPPLKYNKKNTSVDENVQKSPVHAHVWLFKTLASDSYHIANEIAPWAIAHIAGA